MVAKLLLAVTALAWSVPALADIVPGCDWQKPLLAVFNETKKDDSDPAAARELLKRYEEALERCLADRDRDGELDLGEKVDEEADERRKAIRAERQKAAAAAGWPVQKEEFDLNKSDLAGGSGTNPSSREWSQLVGCKGDDAGHIRANALGGKGGKTSRNIFPQSPTWNRGAFREYEKTVKEWVEKCHPDGKPPLKAKVSFTFGDSERPLRPTQVHYSVVGGDPDRACKVMQKSWSFDNPRPSECKK